VTDQTPPATPFHDLEAFAALPRLGGFALSPDGERLVAALAAPDPAGTRYATSLWEVDPHGERPARRLTRSAKGEGGPAFLPDGSVLFVSARPDPAAAETDEPVAALWQLPAGGGEARVVATRPGGISGLAVAKDAGTVVVGSATLPSSTTPEDDAERRKARKDRKVSAILHESYPVRSWDTDLGPDRPRLFVARPGEPAGGAAPRAGSGTAPGAGADEPHLALRDLTGHIGGAVGEEASWDLTPDGATVVVAWTRPEAGGSERYVLVAIDVADGSRRDLLADPEHEYSDPAVSPDGAKVAVLRHLRTSPTDPPDRRLVVFDLAAGGVTELAAGLDRWPNERPAWTPDAAALLVPFDDEGSAPVYRVDVATGEATRLTTDRGAYTGVRVSPDGSAAYAVRSAVDAAPALVRLDPARPGEPAPLPNPAPAPALPGRLEEVTATAEDGSPLRAWLVLPEGAAADAPAPLLLWIHGGPLGSWNAWSWRWNPWLMAAQGYAVLLPDPALSTGYGLEFVRRGWSRWGLEPYTDLLAITDAALKRDDLDPDRTAAMGGSFGGYMANWVAGHTDRFRGIVTHASVWTLDRFGTSTDAYYYWRREFTAEMEATQSPHLFVDDIRTPMLVIHGDKDYRVPIGEALSLWAELAARGESEDGVLPHKFLYFPDENHWVLTPHHAVVWYQTVLAFLASTVLGQEWRTPELLR
jgi:dipeptidyl aminopeptidase/acylaminoacyl peptidase